MARKPDDERAALLAEIDAEMRLTARYTGRKKLAAPVRAAMVAVAREEFVSAIEQEWAYINRPLPIGHGQTISQPFIVALMTDLLDPRVEHNVLEIGTGSGYQAAVLANLVAKVYSLEVVEKLAATAKERLARLGYANVEVRYGDGARGWPEHAPYDGIIVTAAAPEIPPALVMQLKEGGRMVIPVGQPHAEQTLSVVCKDARGEVTIEPLLPVSFVPLVGGGEPGLA
ncbi:MAG: protein-L-isoaspartate(D-aspartate) O-methyltransferase [Alphaproteobacteria bacterium]